MGIRECPFDKGKKEEKSNHIWEEGCIVNIKQKPEFQNPSESDSDEKEHFSQIDMVERYVYQIPSPS